MRPWKSAEKTTVHGILEARILESYASPCSRGSSQPRDGTQVSCIEGGFFTVCHLLFFFCPLLQLIFEETRQLPYKFYIVVAFNMFLCPLNLLEMVIRSRDMIKFTFIFSLSDLFNNCTPIEK